jgi:anti-anti-sigma factor
MRFEVTELDAATDRVTLDGRLDALGAERIETSFTALTSASGKNILVDLSGVGFIGSLGIRLFIGTARVVQRRGRKMVLFGAQAQPLDVFETVALDDLIPVVATESEALAIVAG